MLLYSKNAEADRGFLRDILGFRSVDAGHGWLIFKLPPSEVAVHPSDGDSAEIRAELYLMCDDLRALIASLAAKNVKCSPVAEAPWGLRTTIHLPSGGELGLYQPRHPTALGL